MSQDGLCYFIRTVRARRLLIYMLLSQIGFFASCLRIPSAPDFHSELGILQMNYLLQPAVRVKDHK